MEGPTPVSALIHAATLVTAGVFLIIRCSYIFDSSPLILLVVTIFGGLTAFFASTVGLVQNDLKRVIAYSTCSQLGYMVFACGLSHYSTALFHLFNHALFKALLFLSAGSIIHGLCDEQDLRKMGGLLQIFPIAFVMLLIGSVALTGIPFFTGFYSKDAILEVAASNGTFVGLLAFLLGVFSASFTAYYSARLIFLVFINTPNAYRFYFLKAHEPTLIMLTPLFLLAFGSIFAGFLFKDLFLGLGTSYFKASIFYNFKFSMLSAEFLNSLTKNVPLIFTIFGFLLSYFLLFCYSPASRDAKTIITRQSSFYLLKINRSFIRYTYIFLNYK